MVRRRGVDEFEFEHTFHADGCGRCIISTLPNDGNFYSIERPDVLLSARTSIENIKIVASVRSDLKRPTLSDRVLCHVDRADVDVPLVIPVGRIWDDVIVEGFGKVFDVTCRFAMGSGGSSCCAFDIKGGFLLPSYWSNEDDAESVGVCNSFKPAYDARPTELQTKKA